MVMETHFNLMDGNAQITPCSLDKPPRKGRFEIEFD